MMVKKLLKLKISPKFSLERCEQWIIHLWVDESNSTIEDLTALLFSVGSYNASIQLLHIIPEFRERSYRAWGVSLWSGWIFYYQWKWKSTNCPGEDNKSMKIDQIMPGNIFITRNNTIIFVLPFYNLSWYKRKVQLSVLSKRMCYT